MRRLRKLLRGGSKGNEQLTAIVAALLLVLLAVEGATIVSANHVEGPPAEFAAVWLKVGTGGASPHCTVLGNITHGPIELNGGPLLAPWAALNINA